jgi:NitT/TauT family transport system substrate-binding protein
MVTKKKLLIGGLLLVIFGAFVCLFLGRTQKLPDKYHLRVVYKLNANYLIYFVAKEKGYLKEEGLDLEEIQMESTNLMVEALAAGRADFNPSNSTPALYAAEQNAPGTFLFIYVTLMEKGKTNDAIIVRKDARFNSLTDLKAKTIAAPPGAASVVLLKLIFKDIFDEKYLKIKELEPRIQLQALYSKQVDAIFAIEPSITFGEIKGISRVLEADTMENHIMNPIPIAGGVITTKFATEHPQTVIRLQRAMNKAIEFIRNNEDESKRIMAKAIDMPEGTALRLGVNTYWKLNEVNRDYIQRLADLFLENGALEKRVNTKIMYWKIP